MTRLAVLVEKYLQKIFFKREHCCFIILANRSYDVKLFFYFYRIIYSTKKTVVERPGLGWKVKTFILRIYTILRSQHRRSGVVYALI